MKTLQAYILLSCIIYAFYIISRQNNEFTKGAIVGILIANVISMDYFTSNFTQHFLEGFIFEAIICFVTVVVSKILRAVASMNNKLVLFLFEIGFAFGLCYFYYYANAVLISRL